MGGYKRLDAIQKCNLTGNIGIILDIQQIHCNRDNFISEFEKIPQDLTFGLHIQGINIRH